MINWEQDFLLSNSINHSYDYRPNWTPLGSSYHYKLHRHDAHTVQSQALYAQCPINPQIRLVITDHILNFVIALINLLLPSINMHILHSTP